MQPRTLLILAGACLALLWQLPYGWLVLYPLTLLATYAHEMGHGISALLAGASFEQLLLHADGSGMAVWHGDPGRLASAFIAAGGLLGPTLAGVSILLLSRTQRWARIVLAALALLITLTVVVWVRNGFGVVFLLASAATLALVAKLLPTLVASFVAHGLGLTLCLSWFTDLDYMFSAQAVVNGAVHPSDSAVIAQALFLPYWFWGAVVAAFSLAVACMGLNWASRVDNAS